MRTHAIGLSESTQKTITLLKSTFKLEPLIYLLTNHIVYMYKQDLALNNPQDLIGHKTQPNLSKPFQ